MRYRVALAIVSDATTPTGRLFRSLRAEGSAADDAVPALSLDEVVGLRSVSLASTHTPEPTPEVVTESGTMPDLPPVPAAPTPEPFVAPPPAAPAPVDVLTGGAATPPPPRRGGAHAQRGIGAGSVWLIVIGVTVVMAFADALVMRQVGLGWLTGVALVVASVYAAFTVRIDDAIIAVVAPPLAFFLATLTAGQLTVSTSGDLLVNEAFMIVTTLGTNALWIFGATIAALIIVLIRRGVSRRQP